MTAIKTKASSRPKKHVPRRWRTMTPVGEVTYRTNRGGKITWPDGSTGQKARANELALLALYQDLDIPVKEIAEVFGWRSTGPVYRILNIKRIGRKSDATRETWE
jgi:hypothetical protein